MFKIPFQLEVAAAESMADAAKTFFQERVPEVEVARVAVPAYAVPVEGYDLPDQDTSPVFGQGEIDEVYLFTYAVIISAEGGRYAVAVISRPDGALFARWPNPEDPESAPVHWKFFEEMGVLSHYRAGPRALPEGDEVYMEPGLPDELASTDYADWLNAALETAECLCEFRDAQVGDELEWSGERWSVTRQFMGNQIIIRSLRSRVSMILKLPQLWGGELI